jgi:hypothetical protein
VKSPLLLSIALAGSAAMLAAPPARAQVAADSSVPNDPVGSVPNDPVGSVPNDPVGSVPNDPVGSVPGDPFGSTTLPVAFGADEIRLDAQSQALDASGHVRVDEPPFHLSSDALRLRRVRIGAELEGQGTLAFCPCLGSPLGVRFSGATVAPPHDLILRNPVLEVFGVPLAWVPIFWLRSAGRFGLLPPDITWRGADGLFLGGGVHVPWRQGDLAHGMDLHAGWYVDGGVAVEGLLRTTATETDIRWDRFHGNDGLTIAARGATAIANGDRMDSVAWDIDALQGARAVQSTTDLDAAAKPFNRATAEAAWRPDGWVIASQVRVVSLRGSDVSDIGVVSPLVAVRRAGVLGNAGTYDATVEGGEIGGSGFGSTSFARAEAGALLATRLGPLGASLSIRGLGDVADDGVRDGVDGVGQVRASLRLPLAREYDSADGNDPWVHRTEPRIEAAVIGAHTDGVLVVPAGRGAPDVVGGGEAWIGVLGWSNVVGRAGSRSATDIDLTAGFLGDDTGLVRPLLRARATLGGPWVALHADFARVLAVTDVDATAPSGGALLATARIGPTSGLHLTAHAAERDGVDPYVARALVGMAEEAASGFLSAPGWTGGARAGIPFGSRVTARGGADVDFNAGELVAAVASLELHDPCNCVVLRATASHRIGREGVDAWLSVDLSSPGR